MTASAPIPGIADPHAGTFASKPVIRVPERDTLILSSYIPHVNPENITVTCNGEPILAPLNSKRGRPFTVAQVPPEYRFAIDPNGEVLSQFVFLERFTAWYTEQYQFHEKDSGVKVEMGRIERQHIPNVKAFVTVEVDPTNRKKLKPTHYNPGETAGAVPDHFVDRKGERIDATRIELLTRAYHENRGSLKGYEVKLVEERLGMSNPSSGDIAGALTLLNQMLSDGEINAETHSKRVAMLTGAPMPEEETAVETAVEATESEPDDEPVDSRLVAHCGKKLKTLGQRRSHEALSKKCGACEEYRKSHKR